jgi:hypothetical protein
MRAPLFTNVDEYNQSIENRKKKKKKKTIKNRKENKSNNNQINNLQKHNNNQINNPQTPKLIIIFRPTSIGQLLGKAKWEKPLADWIVATEVGLRGPGKQDY